jgi:hypothetical protein
MTTFDVVQVRELSFVPAEHDGSLVVSNVRGIASTGQPFFARTVALHELIRNGYFRRPN